MYVGYIHMWVQVLSEPRRRPQGVAGSCENTQCVFWELNSGPLQEQYMFQLLSHLSSSCFIILNLHSWITIANSVGDIWLDGEGGARLQKVLKVGQNSLDLIWWAFGEQHDERDLVSMSQAWKMMKKDIGVREIAGVCCAIPCSTLEMLFSWLWLLVLKLPFLEER